jgi:hypothetical protein
MRFLTSAAVARGSMTELSITKLFDRAEVAELDPHMSDRTFIGQGSML